MKQYKIPKYEWPEFILDFGAKNRRKPVSIRQENKTGALILETAVKPLRNIELVEDGITEIVVTAGNENDEEILHVIYEPHELYQSSIDNRQKAFVCVVNAEGEKSIFHFRQMSETNL